jgi:hypothetical protein
MVPLAAIWMTKYTFDTAFIIWFTIRICSTIYNYSWDIYMDWGLLRNLGKNKYFGLREELKMKFPVWFYY